MSAPITTKTIGSFSFAISHIPPRKATRALRNLLKVVGPVIGDILKATKGKSGETDLVEALMSGALRDVLASAGDVDVVALDELRDELARATKVGGVDGSLFEAYDVVFAGGKVKEQGQWLMAAVEHNFGDFWRGMDGAKP